LKKIVFELLMLCLKLRSMRAGIEYHVIYTNYMRLKSKTIFLDTISGKKNLAVGFKKKCFLN